jgi:hypothetical protein
MKARSANRAGSDLDPVSAIGIRLKSKVKVVEHAWHPARAQLGTCVFHTRDPVWETWPTPGMAGEHIYYLARHPEAGPLELDHSSRILDWCSRDSDLLQQYRSPEDQKTMHDINRNYVSIETLVLVRQTTYVH